MSSGLLQGFLLQLRCAVKRVSKVFEKRKILSHEIDPQRLTRYHLGFVALTSA